MSEEGLTLPQQAEPPEHPERLDRAAQKPRPEQESAVDSPKRVIPSLRTGATKSNGTHALSITLVILFIICLIIFLWVLMIIVRLLFGVAG